ncbi:macrolide family glycosyltransferase [Streptomyces sp. A1499]|uniref:macrolide family glycosyltransferase n=1 Tax=Streptomyces sp. A1499 TaxID=2563104 RepID=UPI00109ECC38|nr:macrolide family glycosyltransferase [Streptomyces sp. A1499]THC54251.1 glycosyl transferase [Streptomyces sp. A1499]
MSSHRSPRRRAHIAMIGVPMVSHVLPSLEIIRVLAARGHRVTYANDPAAAALIAPTGAELVPYDSTLPHRDNIWPDDPIEASSLFLDDAMAVLPQLRAAYDDDPADVYLYDIGAYVGRALAEAQGRPVVQLSPTFVAWGSYQQDVGAHLARLPGADALEARFTEWLGRCGATTLDVGEFSGVPPRAIATIPRAMQPHADTVDAARVDFVGPCLGDRADQGAWERPAGASKVLLVSLGSAYTQQPDFYRRCVAAFGDLAGWHVVLQIGKHVDPAELGPVPDSVEVRSWVPQMAILEQADAFVTHAGMGSSSEGLCCGVPMIAVPQGAEQPMNADRLVELGVARRLDTEAATASALREALLDLTSDPGVAERCARLRDEVRGAGGTVRAAELVEAEL